MDIKTYLNFDLEVQRVGRGYQIQVNSPGGEAKATFRMPMSDLALENFILRVGPTRRVVRRIDAPQVAEAKEFGKRLFDAVFDGEVRSCLRGSVDAATNQDA